MPNSKEIEFYLEVKRETDMAILFTDGVEGFWLPKSCITKDHVKDNDYKVFVPEWLAEKKGMI